VDQTKRPERSSGPLTLAIDIGGTHLKAGVLDAADAVRAGPGRIDTPHPSPPAVVVEGLAGIVGPLGRFDRISIGFPGVVRDGKVMTAPNLGTEAWHGYPPRGQTGGAVRQARPHGERRDRPGLGRDRGTRPGVRDHAGHRHGVRPVHEWTPGPHLELSQHPVRGKKTYDQYLGNAAFQEVGRPRWNKRVEKAIGFIHTLTNCDVLYIGGGNSKHLKFELPPWVRIVSNEAGITGGIRLWDAKLDDMFPAA